MLRRDLIERRAALKAEAEGLVAGADGADLTEAQETRFDEITAEIEGLGRIHGAIDRLLVTPDRVLAVDFKTNRVVPDQPGEVPIGLLRQMAAYGEAMRQVWPDREVEVAILWTRGPRLMSLSHDILRASLATLPTS